MIAVCGRIQRDGRTLPLVVHQTTDHSGDLASIGKRNRALSLPDDLKDEMQQASPAEAGEPQGVPDARRLRDCIGGLAEAMQRLAGGADSPPRADECFFGG